ncbi:MAG: response regulator [Acidimicrobiales bacterium]
MSEAAPRVLFVDDAELLATITLLANASERLVLAGTAKSAAAALEMYRKVAPDVVVVVDVRMPGTDGVSLTRALLRGRRDGPQVLVMTAFACDEYLLEALGAGARGFLAKSASWPETVEAVLTVCRGGIALPAQFSARLVELLLPGRIDLSGLSEREMDVLRLIGAGASLEEIAESLNMAEGTARGHVEHLRKKLCLSNRVELALAARTAGLGLS